VSSGPGVTVTRQEVGVVVGSSGGLPTRVSPLRLRHGPRYGMRKVTWTVMVMSEVPGMTGVDALSSATAPAA
jgi:hypothetical protein